MATELRRRGRSRGLAVDLGPAIGDNIAFFSRLCSRVYVADFAAALATHGQTAPVTGLLSDLGDDPVGAVLAWDLLNYLPPERLAELGGILADGCRPGALAFALIGYLKEIPDCPLRFRVHDTTTLAYENRSPHSRLSPRYSPHDLSRLLPAFRVETSYLLRNGYQELVLERR